MNYKTILTPLLAACAWNAQQGFDKLQPEYPLIVAVQWMLNYSKIALMEGAFP